MSCLRQESKILKGKAWSKDRAQKRNNYATPDRQVKVTIDRCPDCGADLGATFRIDSKISEEIPDPQPIIVTEYKIGHYVCPCSRKEVVASNPDVRGSDSAT